MTFLAKTWLKLRVDWSNSKNAGEITRYPISDRYLQDPNNVRGTLYDVGKDIERHFVYKYDGLSDLLDRMHTPAYCYGQYAQGKLIDDCDGFHAAAYHQLADVYDCYLLTYVTSKIVDSHTVLYCKKDGMHYILDYTNVHQGNDFDKLFKEFTGKRTTGKILCWNLVKYDYKKEKYYVYEGDK